MNIELTKEQSQKGDKFIEMLLPENALDRETVYAFFNDKDLANTVCEILEQKGFINLLYKGEIHHFGLITPNNGLATFLKNGGLTKIANEIEYQEMIKDKDNEIRDLTSKNLRLQNKQMKRAVLYSIIGFIAGAIVSNLKEILILLKNSSLI